MENISRTSILKLVRRSGTMSISEDSYDVIRNLIIERLQKVVDTMLLVNSEHGTKTIMSEDVFSALNILGETVTHTTDI